MMVRSTPRSVLRSTLALMSLAAGFLLLVGGCSDDQSAPPSAAPTVMRGEVGGVGFDCPAGWSIVANEEDDAVTLVSGQTIGKFGPTILLQVGPDPLDRTVAAVAGDLADSNAEAPSFKQKRKEMLMHDRGFEYGLFEYSSARSGVAVTESFVVVALGEGKMLVVCARSLRTAWDECEPVFRQLVASLESPPPPE